MKRDNDKKVIAVFSIIGIFFVIWFGLLIAPYIDGGLLKIILKIHTIIDNPFNIVFCKDSLKVVVILLLCYGCCICVYLSSLKNYRRNEEYGSAKWGDVKAIRKKYIQKPLSQNKIMTQNVGIGLDAKKHRRNLNTLVCGGSGAGKTRFYCKPNLMQCNTSFVILDPKGEILRDTGFLLKRRGYELLVFDLISMEKSHCYNPFVYLKNENDVLKLVTNIFKSTTKKDAQKGEQF